MPSPPTRDEYVARYAPVVRVIALRIARRCPRSIIESDDLVQAGLLALVEAAGRLQEFASDAQRDVYLRLRTEGAMLDLLRRRRHERTGEPLIDEHLAPGLPLDQRLELRAAIEQLDALSRHILVLRYWDGLAVAQVAELVGVGERRIRQIEAAALERVREVLDPPPPIKTQSKAARAAKSGT